MTDQDPSARDELLAAYLDGEATPAQRAIVERDPALLARAELLRTVAVAVGEPVMPPPAHVRREHIAAALEASDTAPNVSSMATRRRGVDFTTLAAIAAVVLLILAVPVVLLRGGSDNGDSMATTASESTSDSDSATDDSASEPEVAAADMAPAGDEAAAGTSTNETFDAEESAEAPADEPAEEAADEPAEDGGALADEDGEAARSAALFAQTPTLSLELVVDEQALAAEVLAFISDAPAPNLDDDIDLGEEFECLVEWLDENPDIDDTSVLVIGDAIIDSDFVSYVAVQTPLGVRLVVLATGSCEPGFDDIVQ